MTTPHRAVIIIPHFNDVDRLLTCLDALFPLPDGVDCVVVDNASTQDLTPVRSAYPALRILTETAPGAAMARNRGVADTQAPLLFFLDSDCLPAAGWAETALRVAALDDLVGGAVTVFDETPGPRSGAEAFEAVFAFDNEAYVKEKGFSVTANLLTRRDVFDATGPFRPGVSEDLDWCHRARAAGYGISYAPDLKVGHPSRQDWAALRRKWHRLTAEMFGVNGKRGTARLRWALLALSMPLSAVIHTPRVLRSTALANKGERLRALATLYRLRLTRAVWMLRQAFGGTI